MAGVKGEFRGPDGDAHAVQEASFPYPTLGTIPGGYADAGWTTSEIVIRSSANPISILPVFM
jgi:hypothetical protein